MKASFAELLFGAALFLVGALMTSPAHAYLDPGTGSLILQGLVAGISAVLVAGQLYWTRLLNRLGIGGKKRVPSEADPIAVAPASEADSGQDHRD